MKTALLQLNASDDPAQNLVTTLALMRDAVAQGAGFVCTPEVTNCVSQNRVHQSSVLQLEADDQTLAGLQQEAATLRVWLSIGSLALKTGDADGRFANRSFLIGPGGAVVARYDKIHMFDVTVSDTESYRESAGYRPGGKAVLAHTPFGDVGLSICYDLRFAHLYRALAQAGAEVLLIPSAFSPVTGAAHWSALLQARAIETGSWVIAAAQTGTHHAQAGKPRQTYGHSMVVSPWGEIIADAGVAPGITLVDIDRDAVSHARKRIPALTHDQVFQGP